MQISIPKTFQLGGRTWTVKSVGKKSWYGRCNTAKCLIELSSLCKDEEELAHTFFHELMHAIAHQMRWEKLFRDEAGIDGIAGLLLQVLTTAKHG